MTTIHKLEAIVILALLVVGLALGVGWLHDRQRMHVAEGIAEERKQLITAREHDITLRDGQAKAYADSNEQLELALRTPQQAAQVIARHLPPPPPAAPGAAIQLTVAPLTVERSELSATLQAELPDSPTLTLLTADQAVAIGKDELACDTARNDLRTCQADNADLRASLADEKAIAAGWQAAAKGGTRWQRFRHAAKLAACAGAGAGVASIFNAKPRYAAAAGAGAVTLCSAF